MLDTKVGLKTYLCFLLCKEDHHQLSQDKLNRHLGSTQVELHPYLHFHFRLQIQLHLNWAMSVSLKIRTHIIDEDVESEFSKLGFGLRLGLELGFRSKICRKGYKPPLLPFHSKMGLRVEVGVEARIGV